MSDGPSLDDLCGGVERFLAREVDRRHEEQAKLLDDPMRRYDERGRLRPEILQLIREVREASAAAGFYTMTLPASIGGGAIGWEGLFRVWEVVFQHCGAVRWLGHHAIAHWTKGPNPLLARAVARGPGSLPAVVGGRRHVDVLRHVGARRGQRLVDDAHPGRARRR